MGQTSYISFPILSLPYTWELNYKGIRWCAHVYDTKSVDVKHMATFT